MLFEDRSVGNRRVCGDQMLFEDRSVGNQETLQCLVKTFTVL